MAFNNYLHPRQPMGGVGDFQTINNIPTTTMSQPTHSNLVAFDEVLRIVNELPEYPEPCPLLNEISEQAAEAMDKEWVKHMVREACRQTKRELTQHLKQREKAAASLIDYLNEPLPEYANDWQGNAVKIQWPRKGKLIARCGRVYLFQRSATTYSLVYGLMVHPLDSYDAAASAFGQACLHQASCESLAHEFEICKVCKQ